LKIERALSSLRARSGTSKRRRLCTCRRVLIFCCRERFGSPPILYRLKSTCRKVDILEQLQAPASGARASRGYEIPFYAAHSWANQDSHSFKIIMVWRWWPGQFCAHVSYNLVDLQSPGFAAAREFLSYLLNC
jgi:hypothetical protein